MKKTEILILGGAAVFAWYMLKGSGGALARVGAPGVPVPVPRTQTKNPFSALFNITPPAAAGTSPYSLYDGVNDSLGLSSPDLVWNSGKLTLDGEGGLGFTGDGGLGLTYNGQGGNSGGSSIYSLW